MNQIINLKYELTFFERMLVNILKCGPIPEHIAIIMDGNRRYGKREHLDSRSAYLEGLQVTSYINAVCSALGIKQVTVYAFSIENFKRSKEEVSLLLEDLLPKQLERLLNEVNEYKARDTRIRIIGNLSLLSERTQNAIDKLHTLMEGIEGFTVNIAIAYTSRHEISNAMKAVVKEVNSNQVSAMDINEESIRKHLYLPDKVDCLVRTSGEGRFSDFLLWQIGQAQVKIFDILWPEFGLVSLVKMILNYQRNCGITGCYQ